MHALEVLDAVRNGSRGTALTSSSARRTAASPIACTVLAIPGSRGGGHGVAHFFLAGYRHAPIASARIGLQHPGGAAAEATVEEHLHAAKGQPVGSLSASGPISDQLGQRRHRRVKQHPQPKPSRSLEALERIQRLHAFHVVNTGDSQSVGLGLRLKQSAIESLPGRLREIGLHQLDRALEQEPGRLTVGIANDAPAKRIRRISRNAGSREGGAVQPGRVHVQRVEVDRLRLDPVESMPVRRCAPPVGVPALPDDPTLLWSSRRHPGQHLLPGPEPSQLHSPTVQCPERQVSMSVNQTWGHQGLRQVIAGEVTRSGPLDIARRPYLLDPAMIPPQSLHFAYWSHRDHPARTEDTTRLAGGMRHGQEDIRSVPGTVAVATPPSPPEPDFHMWKTLGSEYLICVQNRRNSLRFLS